MSLTGITAFIKKNSSSLAGKEEMLRTVMSMLSVLGAPAADESEEEAPPKKGTKTAKKETKATGKKASADDSVVYLVTGWETGDIALVGDEVAVRQVADELATQKFGLAKTTAADLKKELKDTGYFGIKVPSKRTQLMAGVKAYAKKNKIPEIDTFADLPDRDAETKPTKSKKPAPKPAIKNKKPKVEEPEEDVEFDESEELAEEEEAGSEEEAEEEEEEKPKPKKEAKGGKKPKVVDSDDE